MENTGDIDTRYTTLKIKYKELEFPSTFRYNVTSPSEIVAYSLGILGVFNGFSVMLVFYCLTLGLWSIVGRSPRATTERG